MDKSAIYNGYQALNQIPAVAGQEGTLAQALQNLVADKCDTAFVDAMGNLICHHQGADDKKILFVANLDTAGIVVTHVQADGFVRFAPVGGLSIASLCNRKVRFANGVFGVVGYAGNTAFAELELSQFYIDLGVDSDTTANNLGVCEGVFADLAGESFVQGDMLCGSNLDNHLGCTALLLAMQQIYAMPRKNSLHFVFSAQGSMGFRGAAVAVLPVQPDQVIAVGTTPATDTPDAKQNKRIALGKGPAITLLDKNMIAAPAVVQGLQACAPDLHTQQDIDRSRGTDAGVMQKIGKGALGGGISIPVRMTGTAYEMAHLQDVADAVDILTAYANL